MNTLSAFSNQAKDIFALSLLFLAVLAVKEVISGVIDRYSPDHVGNFRTKVIYAFVMVLLTFVIFTYVLKRERLY